MSFLGTLQGKKENTAPSLGKFDEQIAETERKISEQLVALGAVYCEKHRDDYTEEYMPFMEAIKELEKEKDILEKNKLVAQGLRLCEHCLQTITVDSAFCNKCGSKLEPLVLSGAEGKFCQSCGASLDEGDMFCASCGGKVV